MIQSGKDGRTDGFASRIRKTRQVGEQVDMLCDLFEQELKAGRAPQLAAFLEQCPQDARSQLLLEMSALQSEYYSSLGEPPAEAPEPAATRVGRYRIDGRLGHGGFGYVYRAYDEILKRDVAIKFFTRSRGDLAGTDAFLREARFLASLHHPHIVPIYDYGLSAEHGSYLVYHYVDGNDVAGLLAEEKRLEPRRAAALVADVAGALACMHGQGIVHQDIKPSNLLLCKNGHVFVTDFGLALEDDPDVEQGGVGGTRAYMSPEQRRGDRETVGPSSDLFSLGMVFYELLTGERPVSAVEPETGKLESSSWHVVPPMVKDRAIPQPLSELCLRLLEAKAEDRPASAEDVAQELREYLRPSHSRRRAVLAAIVALLLLVLGGLHLAGRGTVEAVRNADMEHVPRLLAASWLPDSWQAAYFRWAQSDAADNTDERFRFDWCLNRLHGEKLDELRSYVPGLTPAQASLFVSHLDQVSDSTRQAFLQDVANEESAPGERLRAAVVLASLDPKEHALERWSQEVPAWVLHEGGSDIRPWGQLLQSERAHLGPSLLERIRQREDPSERQALMLAYLGLTEQDPGALVAGMSVLSPSELKSVARLINLPPEVVTRAIERRLEQPIELQEVAKLFTLLALYNDYPAIWRRWDNFSGPGLLAALREFTEHLAAAPVTPAPLIQQLLLPQPPLRERILLLAVGTFRPDDVPPGLRQKTIDRALELWSDSPDASVHGAAAWLLETWGEAQDPATLFDGSGQPPPAGSDRNWYVDRFGMVMIVMEIPPPAVELPDDAPLDAMIPPATRRIAVSATEVTQGQWHDIMRDKWTDMSRRHDPPKVREQPRNFINGPEAIQFCNELSRHEGLPLREWCYYEDPLAEGALHPHVDIVRRTGYRVLFAHEWLTIARLNTTSEYWALGDDDAMDPFCYVLKDLGEFLDVRAKKPDLSGFFHLVGNLREYGHRDVLFATHRNYSRYKHQWWLHSAWGMRSTGGRRPQEPETGYTSWYGWPSFGGTRICRTLPDEAEQ